MKPLRLSSAFKKNLKRIDRRGYDLAKFEAIIDQLRGGKELPELAQAHPLKGE